MYADAIEMIRNAAIQGGFSQVDLAEKSNISPAQISRIFRFKSTASTENLVSLALAVKLPAVDILRVAGKLPKGTTFDVLTATAAGLMDELPNDDKQEIVDFIRMKRRRMETKGNGHRRTKPSESG